MDDRPPPAQTHTDPATVDNGYPLRDEAAGPFSPEAPPPVAPLRPAEPLEEEIDAASAGAGRPIGRRRRVLPRTSPWPLLLALLLLLAGIGVAYAATRPARTAHPRGAPAAPAPAPPVSPAPAPPSPAAPTMPTTTARAAHPPPGDVAVPSVVGSSLSGAVSALKQAKLTVILARVVSNAPAGRVVTQRPAAGTRVPQGGRVQLGVSVQPLVSVPDVTGVQGLSAVHRLQRDHLVASVRYVPSTQPARRVVSQWPPAGKEVRHGTSVRLNLSQGLRPSVTVPDVVGENEATARSDLVRAGLDVRSVGSARSDPTQDGVVLHERPGGGTRASRGSTVTIYVGSS